MTTGSESDKRQHPRVEAELVVRAGALEPPDTSSSNLSQSGIFVRTTRFLPVNAVMRLTVEIPNPRTIIPIVCRVAYVCDAAMASASGKATGMGLEILDLPEDKRAAFEKALADRAGAAAGPRSARSVGALNVVVVDDDANYRELAARPFRKRGDQVRTTEDGLEALSMCLKEPPDVILTDVQMPRMDGWQLLRIVRSRPSLASIPVVFLTMLDGDAERLLGYQLGVDAYMAKPYKPEELLVRVHQIVRRAQSSRSSPVARTTLRGELSHVAPASLLTFLEMERKTGILLLIGERVARLFVKQGKVFRAEIEGDEKEVSHQAIMKVLDWQAGQFEFAPQEVSGGDDVGMSVTALLLEHARLRDEGHGKRG